MVGKRLARFWVYIEFIIARLPTLRRLVSRTWHGGQAFGSFLGLYFTLKFRGAKLQREIEFIGDSDPTLRRLVCIE